MYTGADIVRGRSAGVVACLFALLCAGLPLAPSVHAEGSLVYVIRLINPAGTDSTVRVSMPLPKGIGTNEIIDAGGATIRYDAGTALYCAQAEERLSHGANKEYRVVVKDIWIVPQEDLEKIRQHAAGLAEQLGQTERKEEAASIKRQIDDGLERIESRQKAFSVRAGATAVAHMDSYRKTMELMGVLIADVGALETQATGQGIEVPQKLGPPPPRRKR